MVAISAKSAATTSFARASRSMTDSVSSVAGLIPQLWDAVPASKGLLY